MLSNNSKTDAISDLLREVYSYIDLRIRHFRLDFVSTLTTLLSTLLISVVLLVIFAVTLLFLAYSVALLLAPVVGGLHWAFALVALACVLLGLCFYRLREPLVIRPLTNLIARLFLNPGEDKEEHS